MSRLVALSAAITMTFGAALPAADADYALTVYSSAQPGQINVSALSGFGAAGLPGYALVRDQRKMAVPKGRGEVRFTDVAKLIDPTTVSFASLNFGTRLLLRTTRQLALTDDGRILYERAKSVLGEVRESEAALARNPHQPSGRIRLSSPSLIGRLVIAPLLVEFLRRYPAVAVDLLLIDRAVDMVEEDIQLAVRIGRLRDSQLVTRKLTDLQLIVCAAPAYLAQRGEPRRPDDLAGHDCLVFSDSPGSAQWRFADGRRVANSAYPVGSG